LEALGERSFQIQRSLLTETNFTLKKCPYFLTFDAFGNPLFEQRRWSCFNPVLEWRKNGRESNNVVCDTEKAK